MAQTGYSMSTRVLIDTWWNVNEYGTGDNICADIVLIDTWWNVNEDSY